MPRCCGYGICESTLQPAGFAETALVGSREQYLKLHRESVEDPDAFWGRIANEFYWKDAPKSVLSHSNFDVREGPIDGERGARQRETCSSPQLVPLLHFLC